MSFDISCDLSHLVIIVIIDTKVIMALMLKVVIEDSVLSKKCTYCGRNIMNKAWLQWKCTLLWPEKCREVEIIKRLQHGENCIFCRKCQVIWQFENWTNKNLHVWKHNCDMHPKICTYFTVTKVKDSQDTNKT